MASTVHHSLKQKSSKGIIIQKEKTSTGKTLPYEELILKVVWCAYSHTATGQLFSLLTAHLAEDQPVPVDILGIPMEVLASEAACSEYPMHRSEAADKAAKTSTASAITDRRIHSALLCHIKPFLPVCILLEMLLSNNHRSLVRENLRGIVMLPTSERSDGNRSQYKALLLLKSSTMPPIDYVGLTRAAKINSQGLPVQITATVSADPYVPGRRDFYLLGKAYEQFLEKERHRNAKKSSSMKGQIQHGHRNTDARASRRQQPSSAASSVSSREKTPFLPERLQSGPPHPIDPHLRPVPATPGDATSAGSPSSPSSTAPSHAPALSTSMQVPGDDEEDDHMSDVSTEDGSEDDDDESQFCMVQDTDELQKRSQLLSHQLQRTQRQQLDTHVEMWKTIRNQRQQVVSELEFYSTLLIAPDDPALVQRRATLQLTEINLDNQLAAVRNQIQNLCRITGDSVAQLLTDDTNVP